MRAEEYGLASWYADAFQGRKTASGELYDKAKLTAAHKTLPFGTVIKVTRLDNNQSVRVRVNDRGPYIKGRVVDISRAAAERLDLISDGSAEVRVEVVGKDTPEPASVVTAPSTTTRPTTRPDVRAADEAPATSYNTPRPAATQPVRETPRPVVIETDQPVTVVTEKPTPKPAATKPKPAAQTPRETQTTKGEKASLPEPQLLTNGLKTYDLYKIQLLRPAKQGFGVQVASLSDYDGVMKKVADLQAQWFKNILVSVERGTGSKPSYKIILGPFVDMESAQAYKTSLKKKNNINGFVVNLGEIKY